MIDEFPKLCPFCGHPPSAGFHRGNYSIDCNRCEFFISRHFCDFLDEDPDLAREDTIDTWNRRAKNSG